MLVIFLLTNVLLGLGMYSNNVKIEGFQGLIMSFLFPKHDTVYSEDYSHEGFLKIQIGMSESEVIGILGEPLTRWKPSDSCFALQYSESLASAHYRMRQVYLRMGKVSETIGSYYID